MAAFHYYSTLIAITSLNLLFLSCLPSTTLSQNPGSLPSDPTIAECLLPLVPCAPFVQGRATSPAQPCCDNLKQLYNQQPSCLCLLLNATSLTSFPINSTFSLQLPLLCNLHISTSICSGMPLTPSSPASQVSFGTKTNSTFAGTLRPSIAGFGRSDGIKCKAEGHLLVVAAIAFLLLY
ncbi:non-specific lipid transfer protein GPI-anchored 10-like [Cornus florida]|uniref:non-specific lipid transfer protein GPI-anchored 10-like n=1 Tax=Cornus florida TaxID=4283 RepID=UPI00289D07C9|nr:non-specific lipid transfer protein GPI-anchored 10-like [Cornus florida]